MADIVLMNPTVVLNDIGWYDNPCRRTEMSSSMSHQKDAAGSGHWPLYRYDSRLAKVGSHPFHLDSHKPTIPFKDFAMKEARFAMLTRSNPERAEQLLGLAQRDIDERWHFYEQMAGIERSVPDPMKEGQP